MSAIVLKADIQQLDCDVGFVPTSNICGVAEANAHAILAYRSAGHIASTQWTMWTEGPNGRNTMNLFVMAAGIMALILLVLGWERPRLAVIVAAILWLLYAVYERLVATGVLCDANCNIRVDLVLFFPILGVATFYAYRSYNRPPGRATVVGLVLGAIGLIVFALLATAFGYITLASVAGAGALAFGAYAIKARVTTNPS